MQEHKNQSHYGRLAAMGALSFVSMYVLMYAMVASADDVFNNINQVYMAGLMTVPMIAIELLLMNSMFPNKRVNAVIFAATLASGLIFVALIRRQTVVSDEQFLRSMIPHHSSAILMCEQASIRNEKILRLCKGIVSSQQDEIIQMRDMLREPNGSR